MLFQKKERWPVKRGCVSERPGDRKPSSNIDRYQQDAHRLSGLRSKPKLRAGSLVYVTIINPPCRHHDSGIGQDHSGRAKEPTSPAPPRRNDCCADP